MAVVNEMFDECPTKITGWPLSRFSGVYVSVCDVHAAKWQPLRIRSRDASLLNVRFLAPSIIGEVSEKPSKLLDWRSELWPTWIWKDRATASTSIREMSTTTLNLEWTKSPTRRIIKLTRRANTCASFFRRSSSSTIKSRPLPFDCSIKVSKSVLSFSSYFSLVKSARPMEDPIKFQRYCCTGYQYNRRNFYSQ